MSLPHFTIKQISTVALAAGLTHSVLAVTLASDAFDEAVSTDAPTNWLPDAGDNAASMHGYVQADSLDYAGLVTSTGNSFGLGQKTADYSYTFADSNLEIGETIYVSFLVQSDVADATFSGNFRLFDINDPFGTGVSIGWGSANAEDTNMGFSLNNRNRGFGHVDSTPTGELYAQPDVTQLVVASYTRGSTNANGTLSLWINPNSTSFGTSTPSTADVTIESYRSDSVFNTFEIISNGSGSYPSSWTFDELRIGTDWADVTPTTVPEPSTYALILGVLGMLLVGVRKHRLA